MQIWRSKDHHSVRVVGWKEFCLIYFGLRYVPGNERRHQSHRDSKKLLMLMMFEPSIIFNTMNAKSGGALLHILLTLKITQSKLFPS